jgi:hypothetical protein
MREILGIHCVEMMTWQQRPRPCTANFAPNPVRVLRQQNIGELLGLKSIPLS